MTVSNYQPNYVNWDLMGDLSFEKAIDRRPHAQKIWLKGADQLESIKDRGRRVDWIRCRCVASTFYRMTVVVNFLDISPFRERETFHEYSPTFPNKRAKMKLTNRWRNKYVELSPRILLTWFIVIVAKTPANNLPGVLFYTLQDNLNYPHKLMYCNPWSSHRLQFLWLSKITWKWIYSS